MTIILYSTYWHVWSASEDGVSFEAPSPNLRKLKTLVSVEKWFKHGIYFLQILTKQGLAVYLSLIGCLRDCIGDLEPETIAYKNGVKIITDKLDTSQRWKYMCLFSLLELFITIISYISMTIIVFCTVSILINLGYSKFINRYR